MLRRVAVLALAVVLLGSSRAEACTGQACYAGVSILGESPATGGGVLRFPQAIAYSAGGSAVFVGDQLSGVVQRFGRDGAWELDVGAYADAAQPGRLGVVGGLATDRSGHLFVLDSQNDRVQVFSAASGR